MNLGPETRKFFGSYVAPWFAINFDYHLSANYYIFFLSPHTLFPYQVIVRAAGHILPYDQPRRCFDMIDRFITGRPFDL